MSNHAFQFQGQTYLLGPVPAERFICCKAEEWQKVFADMLIPKEAGTPEFLEALWVESKNPMSSFYRAFNKVYAEVLTPAK
jgi:hypothetical protein